LREVLPRRPADAARGGRHRPRALHLQGADRPHGRPHLGRAERGARLDVLLRAADGRGARARGKPSPAATLSELTYGGDLVSTWSLRRLSCKRRSPVGLLKQPGHQASAKDNSALALAAYPVAKRVAPSSARGSGSGVRKRARRLGRANRPKRDTKGWLARRLVGCQPAGGGGPHASQQFHT